ncbi:MAG TPA: sigma-70 family RNA polymerase sigma factor [Anaerolineae bacterium]|nr:sigma-70 family RNA polymerase sigma factor [Anaerolineae bacterium]
MSSEELLLQRAGAYDAEALAEVYDRYAGPIYGYLYRVLGDAAQAEDLTSEVFVRFLQALRTKRGPRDKLDGWLYRVAHNLAMDLFRRQKTGPVVALDEQFADERMHLSDVVHERQVKHRLRVSIRHLTADQQQVLLLRFAEDRPLAEVARLMGKSEGAVKTLQHRAVSRLRTLLGG